MNKLMEESPIEAKSMFLIHQEFIVDGIVDRSDVFGAIFGQVRDLLEEDLNLGKLQDNGRVGRIEVKIESESGKSYGEIRIPSNLDKVETATMAAALETIEKIGPCTAEIKTTKITSDYTKAKREEIIERAKELIRTSFKQEEELQKIYELRDLL